MRITMLIDDHAIEEILVKDSQVIVGQGAHSRVIYDCKNEHYTYISDENERYWRGTIGQMTEGLRAGVAPMIQALKAQFGDSLSVSLKFTHVGSDVIHGYDVEKYLVEESGDGSTWGEREELWLSRELEEEIRESSAECRNIGEQVARLQAAILLLVYGPNEDDLNEYFSLFDGVFPTLIKVNTIGGWHERKIAEVGFDELSEEMFHLPEHYSQSDNIIEVMD